MRAVRLVRYQVRPEAEAVEVLAQDRSVTLVLVVVPVGELQGTRADSLHARMALAGQHRAILLADEARSSGLER